MMFLVLFSDWNRDLMHMLEQFHLRHFTAAARAGANDSNSNPTPTDILKIWNNMKQIYTNIMKLPPSVNGSCSVYFRRGFFCSISNARTRLSSLEIWHWLLWCWGASISPLILPCLVDMSRHVQAPWFALKAISSELVWTSMTMLWHSMAW